MIKNASQTEKTVSTKDFAHLQNLSSSVTLHQDGFTLQKDVEGEEAVKKYLAAYFDKYDFSHETLAYAANEKTKASFALAYDKASSLQLQCMLVTHSGALSFQVIVAQPAVCLYLH